MFVTVSHFSEYLTMSNITSTVMEFLFFVSEAPPSGVTTLYLGAILNRNKFSQINETEFTSQYVIQLGTDPHHLAHSSTKYFSVTQHIPLPHPVHQMYKADSII